MKYKKAKYEKVMCCPDCNFNKGVVLEGQEDMPDRNDFIWRTEEGEEYIECPCGCRFKE